MNVAFLTSSETLRPIYEYVLLSWKSSNCHESPHTGPPICFRGPVSQFLGNEVQIDLKSGSGEGCPDGCYDL
jgi:hypothetical protein